MRFNINIIKKIFLSSLLFLIILCASINSVFAQCPVDSDGQCGRGDIHCVLGTTNYCCPQLPGGNSCSQVQGSVQPTIPPTNSGGSSNPMEGCPNKESINTAIGCIPVSDTNAFMGWVLGWAVGVGGGIAFLLIVYSSFMIMTSQGDPARLKAGQELLTSAISGLIMLIFSVFILKFIGVDILDLDSFGFNT